MSEAPAAVRPILVGMPGSGKSTVARQLGRRLALPVVDTDAVIEARIGGTIRDFFARVGEAAFRDLEEQVIAELAGGASKVLATGGGAVLRQANRKRLHAGGTVIYLRVSPEYLFRRLRQDTKRPLLQVADPLARLQALFAERDPLYRECAHFTLDAHGASQAMLVNRVVMQLDLMQPGAA
ncbi:MAG: shikimate kinase [Burkholderiaceae bacterium]|jgi:shikimate kinase|nr:shikimate kinase [Burkholderiaceae bacterium]